MDYGNQLIWFCFFVCILKVNKSKAMDSVPKNSTSFILYSYNFVSYFYERNCCSSTSSNHNILHSYHALQINKFIFPVFKFPITFTSVALLNHFSSLLKHLVFLSPHSPPLIPSVALRRELGRYSHLEMSKPKLREMKKLAGG